MRILSWIWVNLPGTGADIYIKKDLLRKKAEKVVDGQVKWTVNYKPLGANYTKNGIQPVLVDTLSEGIELVRDPMGELTGIIAEEMKIDRNGDLQKVADVPVQNLIKYDADRRRIEFSIPDPEKSYRFTYTTDITDPTLQISNSIALVVGGDYESLPLPSQKAVYNASEADARAIALKTGNLAVKKIGKSEGEDVLLKDASFELSIQSGGKVIRKGKTNDDGIYKLGALSEGTYVLKETQAPSGYTKTTKEYVIEVVKTGGVIKLKINDEEFDNGKVLEVENNKVGYTPPAPPITPPVTPGPSTPPVTPPTTPSTPSVPSTPTTHSGGSPTETVVTPPPPSASPDPIPVVPETKISTISVPKVGPKEKEGDQILDEKPPTKGMEKSEAEEVGENGIPKIGMAPKLGSVIKKSLTI